MGGDAEKDKETCNSSAWDKMMEPFDQDNEEKDKELEDELWKEAFGKGSEHGSKPKMVNAGYSPTQRENDEHMPLHVPYRAWCAHCVKGKCHGLPHKLKSAQDKHHEQVPVVIVDCMFMGDNQKEHEEKGMPILVVKDRKKKVIRARVVPQKGKHWYSVKILG